MGIEYGAFFVLMLLTKVFQILPKVKYQKKISIMVLNLHQMQCKFTPNQQQQKVHFLHLYIPLQNIGANKAPDKSLKVLKSLVGSIHKHNFIYYIECTLI